MSEDYNYLCKTFLYFEEALTFFKFDLDKSFSSTHTDNVAKDFLPADFAKFASLKTLPGGNCLYNVVSMFFSGNTGLALERRIRLVKELLCNDIPIYSNYADAKYEVLMRMLLIQSKMEHLVALDMSPNFWMLLVAIFNLFIQKYPTL